MMNTHLPCDFHQCARLSGTERSTEQKWHRRVAVEPIEHVCHNAGLAAICPHAGIAKVERIGYLRLLQKRHVLGPHHLDGNNGDIT